jgi:hypothetical protein
MEKQHPPHTHKQTHTHTQTPKPKPRAFLPSAAGGAGKRGCPQFPRIVQGSWGRIRISSSSFDKPERFDAREEQHALGLSIHTSSITPSFHARGVPTDEIEFYRIDV